MLDVPDHAVAPSAGRGIASQATADFRDPDPTTAIAWDESLGEDAEQRQMATLRLDLRPGVRGQLGLAGASEERTQRRNVGRANCANHERTVNRTPGQTS